MNRFPTTRRDSPLAGESGCEPSASVTERERFFVSVMLPEEANTENLVGRAEDIGLVLTPGAAFFADPEEGGEADGDRFVRLPFCAVPPGQIEEGVRRLASLI